MKVLYGITVAMITPINYQNSVDYEKLRELTNMLIAKGVNCLYACGTDGEMYHLSTEERMRIAETIVQTAAGRVVVYIHCGAMMEEDTTTLMQHAEKIGADGVGIVTPSYFPITNYEMEEYYIRISQSVSSQFPLFFYNIPQATTNDLKPNVAQRIVQQVPQYIGIKYNYPNINQTLDYININQRNFVVLQGDDRTLPAWLALGCYGTVAGSANVFPEPLVASYAAFKEGDLAKSQYYGAVAARFVDALKGDNIAYFKAALSIRGLDVGTMRPPLLGLNQQEITSLYQQLDTICRETGIPLNL